MLFNLIDHLTSHTKAEYPHFSVRNSSEPWMDGTWYLQSDAPGHVTGRRLDGSIVWEYYGLSDDAVGITMTGPGRYGITRYGIVAFRMHHREFA